MTNIRYVWVQALTVQTIRSLSTWCLNLATRHDFHRNKDLEANLVENITRIVMFNIQISNLSLLNLWHSSNQPFFSLSFILTTIFTGTIPHVDKCTNVSQGAEASSSASDRTPQVGPTTSSLAWSSLPWSLASVISSLSISILLSSY